MSNEKKKFYQRGWFLWLMLICLPPIGIILLWVCHKKMNKVIKIILTIIFVYWIYVLTYVGKSSETEHNEIVSEEKIEQEIESDTETSTIEEQLQEDIVSVVGENMLETFNYVPAENFILIKFKGSENLTKSMTVESMYMDISRILEKIQDKTDYNIDFNVTYPLVDASGNISEPIVIKCTFTNETIKNIDFDSFDYNNIPVIADEWWNHNALGGEEADNIPYLPLKKV